MHGLEVCMTLDRETAPDRFSWCGRSRARILGRLAQAEMAQRAVDPQPRELLLHAVLAEPRAQNVEVDAVEILILVEASKAWKYLPSMLTCCGSSRPSTVLGCVPAATRIERAGSTTSRDDEPGSGRVSSARSSPWAGAESLSARAQPKRSSSTSCGVRRSAKPIPSSSAFATSSWLSV